MHGASLLPTKTLQIQCQRKKPAAAVHHSQKLFNSDLIVSPVI
jgi:hypothetical protein